MNRPYMLKVIVPLLFFFSFILLYSCSKQKASSLPDSLKSYTLAQPNCSCEPFIDEYRWKGEIVYVQSCRGSLCYCVAKFYDAEGVEINMSSSFDKFQLESKFIKNVWTCNSAAKGL